MLPGELRHNGHELRRGQGFSVHAQHGEIKFARLENLKRASFHRESQALDLTQFQFFGVMIHPAENLSDKCAHGVVGDAGRPITGDRQPVMQRNVGASHARKLDDFAHYLVGIPILFVGLAKQFAQVDGGFFRHGRQFEGRRQRRRRGGLFHRRAKSGFLNFAH